MLIAKLTISYDRGLARNDEKDLALDGARVAPKGFKTADGKVVRGLGTHFKSEQDALLVGERDAEARRVYQAFRSHFLATPLDGVYVVPGKGVAARYVESLNVQLGIKVRVTEFELAAAGADLEAEALSEWAERIRRQLAGISLGRSKQADEDGLKALESLSNCPVINKETGKRIREMVAGVRNQTLARIDLKRSLEKLEVKLDTTTLRPRSTPKLVAEVA